MQPVYSYARPYEKGLAFVLDKGKSMFIDERGDSGVEQAVAARCNRGFSMIEAMVALAIVGILAALAAPWLYSGVVRDQVVESACADRRGQEEGGADSGQRAGAMPADNVEAGLPAPDKMVGNYVKSVTVRDGVIEVVFGNKASRLITDKVLTFRPAVVDDAPVVPVAWVCGLARRSRQDDGARRGPHATFRVR